MEGLVYHKAYKAKWLKCANVLLPAVAPHISFFPFLPSLNLVPHLNGIEQGCV